ncbi:pre-RNA processing PIH1/Nop17-domain-containing protein [Lipomyces japonicus]|uniref:pre-RNA processing PIH1/Nop17-domain-containing protein n=1 Tax=Lipomyces japonicus TaxID=56871 RepID=UPI0034CD8B6E
MVEAKKLKPLPGYVIKTSLAAPATNPKREAGLKVFINVCYHKDILDTGDDDLETSNAKHPFDRDIRFAPIIVSEGRFDTDKAGAKCFIYDVCTSTFHYKMISSDQFIKKCYNEGAITGVEQMRHIKVLRDYKTPRLQVKGQLQLADLKNRFVHDFAKDDDPEQNIIDTIDQYASQILQGKEPWPSSPETSLPRQVQSQAKPSKSQSNSSTAVAKSKTLLGHEQERDHNDSIKLSLNNEVNATKPLIEEVSSSSAGQSKSPQAKKVKTEVQNKPLIQEVESSVRELPEIKKANSVIEPAKPKITEIISKQNSISAATKNTDSKSTAVTLQSTVLDLARNEYPFLRIDIAGSNPAATIKLAKETHTLHIESGKNKLDVNMAEKSNFEKIEAFYAKDTGLLSIFV